jgi:lipid-binding SYLF domain-containing protein
MKLSARSAAARRLLLVAALATAACSSANAAPPESGASSKKIASERDAAADRLDKSTSLVTDFRGKVPYEAAREVLCVVAVPSLVQGGLVFGGGGGQGFAICRGDGSPDWGVPAPVSISGGSFGAQIGVQSTDVMALIMTDKARQALLGGHFRVGVDASASAGATGTGTSADFKLGSDVLTYVRSQGLFAGATFSGATISRDDDATEALYGGLPDLRSLLEEHRALPSASAGRFVAVVRDGFGPAARPLARR